MGIRRRRRGYGRDDWLPLFAIAFGLGLFLALFCSVKLALVVAAIALIYIGINCRPC